MSYLQLFKDLFYVAAGLALFGLITNCSQPGLSDELLFQSYHFGCIDGAEGMYEAVTKRYVSPGISIGVSDFCGELYRKEN